MSNPTLSRPSLSLDMTAWDPKAEIGGVSVRELVIVEYDRLPERFGAAARKAAAVFTLRGEFLGFLSGGMRDSDPRTVADKRRERIVGGLLYAARELREEVGGSAQDWTGSGRIAWLHLCQALDELDALDAGPVKEVDGE